MKPGITLDLRHEPFDTMHEFAGIVRDLLPQFEEDFPDEHLCGVVISDHHLKMLRLERYLKGVPLKQVKKSGPSNVCGLPVIIALPDGRVRCPECGGVHDVDVEWG
jgi:hypothetical protein